jgi:hydroxymethylpyrimidine pyrophosphatase-like HAD family hydrolase
MELLEKHCSTALCISSVNEKYRYKISSTSSGLTPIYLYLQKLLLFDSAEEDSSVLRQHCSELTEGKARVLKMQPNMIDIVPLSASKGGGVRILLDHLGITEYVSIYSHRRTIFSVQLL